MRSRVRKIVLLPIALASFYAIADLSDSAQSASAAPESFGITVTEWSSEARVSEPVTSGVPISPSQVNSSWALFDGPQEIPLQTTVLPGRNVPWLLLDFQTSLSPTQAKTFTLREQPPTIGPAQAVSITEDAQTITVTTGPLRTDLSKTSFNLLDNVWFDRDGNGVFSFPEQVLHATPASNLLVHDAASNTDFSGRGLPQKLVWEYRGPMRATLRVDGAYVNGANTLLNYTTRLTWYAGQSYVKIEHDLRNSYPARERYVKLSSAKLEVGATLATTRTEHSGSFEWSNVGATGAAIELIPPTVDVSTIYNPDVSPPILRQNSSIDVDANGGLLIGDLSHFGATWQVDFASGLSASEIGRRTAVSKDPLLALADQGRYSSLSAFGQLHFGSYDDEKNAYRKWGWTWPTAGNLWSQEHNRPRVQFLYPSWSTIDGSNDPESDDLWQNLVMLSRVQIPFYLDRARAWARYVKWEWPFRTDGFTYVTAWGDYWDGPGTPSRQPMLAPPLTSYDAEYIANDMKRGKLDESHMWNGGLLDYYYMTGDRDALDAAIDVAEQVQRFCAWQNPTANGVGGNSRFPSRCLLILMRTWEATNDPQWKAAADHLVNLFTLSPSYDPRGFFYRRIGDLGPAYTSRFPSSGKDMTPFQMTTVVEALYRYWLDTNDVNVQTQLLQIATFARDHALDPATGYSGDEVIVDDPLPDSILHVSVSVFRNTTPLIPYAAASSSECLVNAQIIGYRLTGDVSFLNHAKLCWNQGSKRDYVAPYNQTFATDTQVGRFANSLQGWNPASMLFPEGGDWTAVSLLFYDAGFTDITPPNIITDLHAEP